MPLFRLSVVCFVVSLLFFGSLRAGEPLVIERPAFSVEFVDGDLYLRDAAHTRMLKLDRIRLMWDPTALRPVASRQTAPGTVQVDYETEKDSDGKTTAHAVYTVGTDKIRAEYRLAASPKTNVGGTMIDVIPQHSVKSLEGVFKSGIWTRSEKGGVPYEKKGGYFRGFEGPNATFWMLLAGNHNWGNGWSQHVSLKKDEKQSDADINRYTAAFDFFVMPRDAAGREAAAVYNDLPVDLELKTKRNFNLFEVGKGKPVFQLNISNTSGKPLGDLPVRIVVRNYDGKVLLDKTAKFDIAAGKRESLDDLQVPADERGIFFVEASATVDGKECFTRTNIAMLPPYEYRHPEKNVFGMAAHFDVPGKEAVFELMKRLGVRTLRSGDNRKTLPEYGMVSYGKADFPKRELPKAERPAAAEQVLKTCDEMQCPIWESGNEWNMNASKEEKKQVAELYADWVKEFAAAKKRGKFNVDVISQGLAGQDDDFVRYLNDAGGYAPLAGIAFHPGRGNTVPDFVGSGWTYLGTIRAYQKLVGELGAKPLFITEAYAGTEPNNWWKDSYRQAAENTVLTFALAMAEKIETVMFYQLHDTVWHDIGGVDPNDHEYHYGLLMRDTSLKPSALAFAAAAESLDGAEFVRYLAMKTDENFRGIGFKTPQGNLAILYDRTDGFFQSKKSDDFVHAEPWTDHWKTVREISLPAKGKTVRIVDQIGRGRTAPVVDGKVKLRISGAPLMVYGISF